MSVMTPEAPLELRYLDPASLTPQAANPWTHPSAQAVALSASLDVAGWAGAALFNLTTQRLIDGHLRRQAAIDRGELLPVLCGRWTEAQERLLLRTVNPIAMLAEGNAALLAELDAALAGDFLAGLLERPAGLDGLLGELNGKPTLTGDLDALPPSAPARCQPGDIWSIGGGHRLMCGDSTQAEDVGRLMGGERARLLVTDPPYAVAYVDKARDMNRRGYGHSRATLGAAIEGDGIEDGQEEALWRDAFQVAYRVAVEEASAVYSWHAPGRAARVLCGLLEDLGLLHHASLIWVKPNFVIGRGDYQWMHEPCFYGWKQGHRPPFYGERNQTTVWDVARDTQHPDHPTQKPVELFRRPMQNHLKRGEIAYDPFMGSGTAIVAAEAVGVRAYCGEVSVRYCDLTLARAEALGLEVRRVEPT